MLKLLTFPSYLLYRGQGGITIINFVLQSFYFTDIVFCCLPCADQINTRPSRARPDQEVLGLGNGDHKAEASVSAVPTYACCLTP